MLDLFAYSQQFVGLWLASRRSHVGLCLASCRPHVSLCLATCRLGLMSASGRPLAGLLSASCWHLVRLLSASGWPLFGGWSATGQYGSYLSGQPQRLADIKKRPNRVTSANVQYTVHSANVSSDDRFSGKRAGTRCILQLRPYNLHAHA